MTSTNQVYTSGTILELLSSTEGPLGDLVRRYSESVARNNPSWLNEFFLQRAQHYHSNSAYLYAPSSLDPVVLSAHMTQSFVAKKVRLKHLSINYFRGFQSSGDAINLDTNLVVIDGRNSSGKTSLAEALEWLFTGRLARRESVGHGNPKELQDCICNSFRPVDQKTWVMAAFSVDGQPDVVLKRVLMSDYGPTSNSYCSSELYMNGNLLSPDQERQILDDLFGNIPPILMQHTLRSFVQSDPAERHSYFERLLNLDQLTGLIEKTKMSETESRQLANPSGTLAIQKWDMLRSECTNEKSKREMKKAEKESSDLRNKVVKSLVTLASLEFQHLTIDTSDLATIVTLVEQSQKDIRQKSFPLLAKIRPKQQLGERTKQILVGFKETDQIRNRIKSAVLVLENASEAGTKIGEAKVAIAKALELLKQSGTISEEYPQVCPLCESQAKTLTSERVQDIESWIPVKDALASAKNGLEGILSEIMRNFEEIRTALELALPNEPSEEEWAESTQSLNSTIMSVIPEVRKTSASARDSLNAAFEALNSFEHRIKSDIASSDVEDLVKQITDLAGLYSSAAELAVKYASKISLLEQTVGAISSEDAVYSLQEKWLAVASEVDNIVIDLLWEQAKEKAREELKQIREDLIQIRQSLLESKRVAFSQEMTSVWKSLRSDDYSYFSKLSIPMPSGKGFPIKIEIKALLDNGESQQEVDALRVFSESQIHALGIAAFVTRAKILGHTMLIFDDPVQSMDAEHFRTFAYSLLKNLLQDGFQVIILTHNDTFARRIDYAHYDRSDYITFKIRHSKREGCKVDEGRRRVNERLKIASKMADEGRLEEGWNLVRLAMERLYITIYQKYGPSTFDPMNWSDQTAEYMWKEGVGEIVNSRLPGKERRLKEILAMTASGAHDKPADGVTDLRTAIKDLKTYATALGVS